MSQEPITFDPSTWTGIKPQRWPNPKDYPYPLPVEARQSRRKHLLAGWRGLLAGCGLLLLGLLIGIYPPLNKSGWGLAAGLAIFAIPFVVLGWVTLRQLRRYGTSSEPWIEMTARSLVMPRYFEIPIPWSEVTDIIPGYGIVIRDETRFKPTALRAIQTSRRHVPVRLPPWLDVSEADLITAIHAHRAHFGNGGQSG